MIDRFLEYCSQYQLFAEKDKILLGVSGGVDSMVMLDLFIKTEVKVGIAHVNFQLRGNEADDEQDFVRKYAMNKDIAFHTVAFDTHDYANEKGVSVQVAARQLRYNWFEEIRRKHGYSCVAVAHNKNDEVESLLINLTRGTGIRGITGIKPKQNNVIRPVLFAERKEIMEYASLHNVPFKEDSSNLSVKYSRNRIRHNIIPEFENINPRFIHTVAENIERFQSVCNIYDQWISEVKNDIVTWENETVYIDIEALKNYEEKNTILFEILREFTFTKEVTKEIFKSVDSDSGKCFYSQSHKLIKDRQYLIVAPLQQVEQRRYYIEKGTEQVTVPVRMTLREVEKNGDYIIPKDRNIASLDYDKLVFPLIIRKWEKGDYFKPLGLNHYKKLSDFFIDRKYSLVDKERVWLLTSGEKIVWVIGDRIDDNFKVTPYTRKVLQVEYSPD
ncbi:MAG: tRNA lysidine(34) synthetase TilS [Bacteroidales bacterium]